MWAHSLTSILALFVVLFVWGILNKPMIFIIALIIALTYGLTFINLDDINNLTLIRKLSSSSSEATISGLLSVIYNTDIAGNPINLRVTGFSGEFSIFSVIFWSFYIILIFVNIINELRKDKKSKFAYALLFLFVSLFKDIFHSPQSVILLYVYLLFFSQCYTTNILKLKTQTLVKV